MRRIFTSVSALIFSYSQDVSAFLSSATIFQGSFATSRTRGSLRSKKKHLSMNAFSYDALISTVPHDDFDNVKLEDNRILVLRDVNDDHITLVEDVMQSSQSFTLSPPPLSKFDLSSPREWMEYLEATATSGRNDSESMGALAGSGAYTVLRCEGECKSNIQEKNTEEDLNLDFDWKVWGKHFHWTRLKDSISTLMQTAGRYLSEEELEQAMKDSDIIFQNLLSKMKEELLNHDKVVDNSTIQLMTTFLWTPDSVNKISVRGHIKYISSFPSNSPPSLPAHIVATLAVPSKTKDSTWIDSWENLPKRYNASPTAKASSWCRIRRSLESTQSCKPIGVGEVLLTRELSPSLMTSSTTSTELPCISNIEILEGLTSNFFAIFADGTIRSQKTDVLPGYAKELVLKYCQSCGLIYDPQPILISDLSKCVEAFVTSSIRLVIPIRQILIPKFHTKEKNTVMKQEVDVQTRKCDDLIEIWSLSSRKRTSESPWNSPYSEAIYDAILSNRDEHKFHLF